MPDEDDPSPSPSDLRPYLTAYGGGLDDPVPDSDPVSRLRPYLLTSGRAEPVDQTLEIEAQVMTTDAGNRAAQRLPFEHRDIVRLCV
ncbi:MAG TPA: DUF742 domain-containing protein, partial [Trebonia sp.]